MNVMPSKAKVYYLPAAEPVEPPAPLSRRSRLRNRVINGWWRMRMLLTDVRLALRGRRHSAPDEYSALLRDVVEEGPAEVIDRRRSRPSRPATILDFESARLRLRPAND